MTDFFEGFEQGRALFERAVQVIPGGIYGHHSPTATVPGASPYYAVRAKGCRYEDVDGRSYIDYMCGYGPIILGHAHAEVEEAAERQRREGDCFNHPTARMVELAERLVGLIDFADWAVFGKNGSDMTSWLVQVARESTGRKKLLKVKGAYHGTDAWCTPGHAGLIPEDRMHIHDFRWNDLASLDELLKRYRGEVAAVMLTPYHHPIFADSVFAEPGFIEGVQERCRKEGILVLLDDIRAGFRLDVRGSHHLYGIEPDLACYCKALGNGYALSAAVGKECFKVAASKVFLTGSYWNNAVAMAATLATLAIVERDQVPAKLDRMGRRLAEGFARIGERHGLDFRVSGPPAAPTVRFGDDPSFARFQRFCAESMKRGAFFHPHHNWFLCAAHGEADIDETLEIAEEAARACS